MKRSEPSLIGDIIRESLRRDGIESRFNEQRAAYLWAEVVGPGVNRYTSRRYVEGGILHVYITSASLKQELAYLRARLTEAINAAVGAEVISDIHFH